MASRSRGERYILPRVIRSLASFIVAVAFAISFVGNARADEPNDATEETADAFGRPTDDQDAPRIRYFIENVEVHTNGRTTPALIRRFVPIVRGDVLDVDDPKIDAIKWRLLGTGWFREVSLHLERGSRRGWVKLVVEVEERNTLVVDQIVAGLAEGLRATTDTRSRVFPYGGLSVTESNFFGTGLAGTAAFVASAAQQGGRVRFGDPSFLGSSFALNAMVFANNAREFFGNDNSLVSIQCPPTEDSATPPTCPPEVAARNAVVRYRRFGMSLGTGHDLGASTRYTLDWQGELVDVLLMPDAASESYGNSVRAIDFSINRGKSIVSTVQFGLVYDRRDDPAMPTRGVFLQFRGDLGSPLIGSNYNFLRLQVSALHYFSLPWGHVLRLGGFLGGIFGRAPFFYKFYASDLSDLIPSRALDLNLDRRPPPNLFNTSIREMRSEDFGARLDVGYSVPLYKGTGSLYAIEAYGLVGVYALFSQGQLGLAIPGYQGLSRIPLDLTFDIGLRADTDYGVFQFGLSSVLGFVTQ